jgi:hypothetical protein
MQVSIAQVTFPQPGRKFGKLQLSDGQIIWVPPELLGKFQGGTTVEINTKPVTWGQGTDARNVIVATTGPLQPGMGPPQQGNAYGQYGQAGTQPAAPRPNTGFQPRVYEGGGRPRTDYDSKMIFVTGVVGRAMGSGKFTASEIAVLAQEAARTYDLVTTPSPKPQPQAQEPPTADAWPESQEPVA